MLTTTDTETSPRRLGENTDPIIGEILTRHLGETLTRNHGPEIVGQSVYVKLIASAIKHAEQPNVDTLRDLKAAAFEWRKEKGIN